jgi:hypothetical protein
MDTTTQPATEVDWYLAHIERLTGELAAADTPAATAIARGNLDSCRAAIRRIKEDEAAAAWWCVVLEDEEHVQVAYRGNGGFGPVNVWQRGWYVPVRYRQRTTGPDRLCDCEVA